MPRHAVIDQAANRVENVVEWDGVTPWTPGPGRLTLEIADNVACEPGSIFDPATQQFSDGRPLAFFKRVRMDELRALMIVKIAESLPNFDGNETMSRAETALLIMQLTGAAAPLQQRLQDIRTNYQTHANALRGLATRAQVIAYSIDSGWPA